MRLLTALIVGLLAVAAQAARLIVHLPENAAIRVTDATPPSEGPRIDCPPDCVYENPGNGVGIFDLKVEPFLDPRNNDRPWDIIAMPGCRGTSALPADNAKCSLPSEGAVDVYIQVQYRPILAVTYKGSYGGPLMFSINGNPGPNYQGSGSGFACYPNDPTLGRCSAHLSAGQPVTLRAPSTDRATLLGVSPPCGSGDCLFTLTQDTCIEYEYKNGNPDFFTTIPLTPIECPTGPGVTGGGGGPPPLNEKKLDALEKMRRLFRLMISPCGGAALSVALFGAGGPLATVSGAVMLAAASPICAIFVHDLLEWRKIYNDPPDLDFHRIVPIRPSARPAIDLPSCDELSGADRRTCRRLGKAVVRYVAKAQHVADVLDALRVTVERASAAAQANDQRALKRQLRAADKRSRQVEAALRARAKAGTKVAAGLTNAGATGSVNEAQFTEISTAVLARLAEQGLPEAEARTLLGAALTPAALDLVALLGEP